jgi:class 3 adenylate cyclase
VNLLEVISQVRSFLEQNGRVSYRVLRRQFDLDEETLDELREELVDVQQVAADEGGRILVWTGPQAGASPPAATPAAEAPPASTAAYTPKAYTPKHLADPILTSRSALEGELKQVTVLFADVKGSMELAAQMDPEGWHRILDRFFQILADGVHRFEGTVNQYTGDGIMALFGAPIAHEDHAQRACYAALELHDRLEEHAHEVKREHGLTLSTRIGLNSGEVVVGKIGDDLRMDYTAQGHTVGLAARMQELASPDTIYLAEPTATLVSGYFELRDLGTFQVKGVAEPMPVHELQGVSEAQTRFDVSRSRGLRRPARARAGSASSSSRPAVPRVRGCTRASAWRTARTSRCCPSCRCSGSTTGSPSGTTTARRARRSRGACCSSTRATATCCRCSSSCSAYPTPTAPRP